MQGTGIIFHFNYVLSVITEEKHGLAALTCGEAELTGHSTAPLFSERMNLQ